MMLREHNKSILLRGFFVSVAFAVPRKRENVNLIKTFLRDVKLPFGVYLRLL